MRLQVREWITLSYPTAQEDPELSQIVNVWLLAETDQDIFEFTWNTAGYEAGVLSGSSVIGSYSESITSHFIVGDHLKQPDATYTKFGVALVLYEDYSVKIQVLYAQ